jgi:hypothetical protein
LSYKDILDPKRVNMKGSMYPKIYKWIKYKVNMENLVKECFGPKTKTKIEIGEHVREFRKVNGKKRTESTATDTTFYIEVEGNLIGV